MTTTLSRGDVDELRNRILSEWASFKNPAGGLMTSFTGPELEAIAAALASQSLSREAEIRREVIEECAKVARRYADNPVGGPEQDSEDAFLNSGMTYTVGGADNALAIEDAIRALAQRPDKEP